MNNQKILNAEALAGLTFYCKECQKIIDVKPTGFKVICPSGNKCTDIAYGTERSIKNFYKIRDAKFDQERLEREKLALRADKL